MEARPLEIEVARDGDRVGIVALHGDFDLATASAAAAAFREAGAGAERLVIDLGDCDFVDSTGLASIVHVSRELRDQGAAVVVVAREGSEVRRLLELTGIQLAVEVVASRDDALALD